MPLPVSTPLQEDLTSAGHPALEFINTLPSIDGELVDSFQSDGDVLRWLAGTGWPVDEKTFSLPPFSLLEIARALRLAIRVAVEGRKTGEQNP